VSAIQIQRPTIDAGPFVFGQPMTRRGQPLSFPAFVSRVNPRYAWYPYLIALAAVLERVAAGELSRLMIFAPPRHGKSELVSRLFSAYYLYRYPARWVGLNSYAAELAYTLSRNARGNYTRAGRELSPAAWGVKQWETAAGGGMWAAGVGGPITGKGFHLGIIDDPVKNAKDAASETIRAAQWDWYQSTFYTRQEPGAAIVMIQTRWHEDDLSGRLLAHEAEEPECWHVAHLPALKEEPPSYPPTVTLEPDARRDGEALAPRRYPADKLAAIMRSSGDYYWGALYQQRPRGRDGNLFKREWFPIVTAAPAAARYVRYWDKAGTTDGGAYTAGVLLAEHNGVFTIVDLIMGQWAADERESVIVQTAAADRAAYGYVEIGHEQEPGSGGKESAEATTRRLAGYVVYADRPTGDKALRAEPVAAQAAAGNVRMVAAPWNGRLLDILTAFPLGAVRDPVDALSGGFSRLVKSIPTTGVTSYVQRNLSTPRQPQRARH